MLVAKTTAEAEEKSHNGGGPTLIEAHIYRWRGHSKSAARKYRTHEEEKEWKKQRDPIALFKTTLRGPVRKIRIYNVKKI